MVRTYIRQKMRFLIFFNISFDQITSEVLLNALDQKGICVSAKSTCSSQNTNASEVLLAMHKSEFDATHGIRLSFSYENTLEEAKYFIETCKEIIRELWLIVIIIS